jgi:F-type H+-transporting ATPase subunit b
MPVPFGALALNAAILYFLLFKFGRKPISDALKARKLGIMKGMEDAAKMKAEAEASLAKYQKKLDEIDSEVARIKREAKEQGEAESARILGEAKERRARMERDARLLVEQELKAARENLTRDTVRAAVKSAEAMLTAKVGDADQQRLGDEFLASIKASGTVLRGRL